MKSEQALFTLLKNQTMALVSFTSFKSWNYSIYHCYNCRKVGWGRMGWGLSIHTRIPFDKPNGKIFQPKNICHSSFTVRFLEARLLPLNSCHLIYAIKIGHWILTIQLLRLGPDLFQFSSQTQKKIFLQIAFSTLLRK